MILPLSISPQPKFKAFVSLLLVVSLGYWATSYWVKQKVARSLDQLPGISYQNLAIDVWQGNLQLDSVCVETESMLGDSLEKLRISQLRVEDISYWHFFRSKVIVVDHLVLAGVNGTYRLAEEECPEENNESEKKSDWTEIKVKKLEVSGAAIQLIKNTSWELVAAAIDLQLNDYVYRPGALLCPRGWKSFTGELSNVTFYKQEAFYRYAAGQILLNGEEDKLMLSQFAIVPVYNKEDWSHQFPYKKSRLQLEAAEIHAENFAFERLINDQKISLDTLKLFRPQLEVYSNEVKLPCSNCYKPLLHEKIGQLDIPLNVASVVIEEGEITVDTWSSSAEQKVELVFSQLDAQILDLSNQDSSLPIKMNTSCYLFGNVPLEVNFNLSMEPPLYPYSYSGWLGAVDLRRMNSILGEASKVDMKSGHISQLYFNATADNNLTTGEVLIQYDKLKVALQNDDNQSRKVLSAIVNTLLIDKKSEGLESGAIYYPRDPNHGFFHQCWHSLKSGLSSVVLPNVLLSKALKKQQE